MKFSLLLSALILLGCGWIGWRGQAAVSLATASHERLMAEAKELGLSPRDPSGKTPPPRNLRSERESASVRADEARAFSARLISFALKIQEAQESGESEENEETRRATEQESLEVMDQLTQLDPEQLKIVVGELRANSQLSSKMRSGILGFALASLAESDPAGTLALFATSPELVKESSQGESAICFALARVAEKRPEEAAEWFHTNMKEHPELTGILTAIALTSGTAGSDPRQAFALIDELQLPQVGTADSAARGIASAAKTPAERTAVLAALRDHLAGVTDEVARKDTLAATLRGLAQAEVQEGYDKTAPWLDSANLSREELQGYLTGLDLERIGADSGKWLAWMSAKLPPEDYRDRTGDIMRQWATRDYRAAGAWLSEQPDGQAKVIATWHYATTLAPYQPELAAQWVQTLPSGEGLTQAKEQVYQSWKKKDPAAAEAFARGNGLVR